MPRSRITLPTLLAQLPALGRGSLVQPAAWAERFPNSFYKITRTNLRVKPVDGSGNTQGLDSSTKAVETADVKGKAKEEDDAAFGADDMEIGEVSSEAKAVNDSGSLGVEATGKRAHGKAWGVLFWNGKSDSSTEKSPVTYGQPCRLGYPIVCLT